jgi:hypothetical protein
MNPKSFPHPDQAPLGAGTGVAARPHPSRTIFLHAPDTGTAKRRGGCCQPAALVPEFFPHAPKQALADGRVSLARRHPSGW